MPICPNCKEEIEELLYSENGYGRFYLEENGISHYNQKDGGITFECPECLKTIASTEEDAINYLNNKLKVPFI